MELACCSVIQRGDTSATISSASNNGIQIIGDIFLLGGTFCVVIFSTSVGGYVAAALSVEYLMGRLSAHLFVLWCVVYVDLYTCVCAHIPCSGDHCHLFLK